MAQVKTGVCVYCTQPVSEMAGFTKLSMTKIAHSHCYAEREAEVKLAQQGTVLREIFERSLAAQKQETANLLDQLNAARATKGESAVVSKTSDAVFDTKTWDDAAEDICKLACAHIGPALPLNTLKRYAWFIYTKLRDKKLIQPLSDDNTERPLTDAQLKDKAELEAWLSSTKTKTKTKTKEK